MKNIKGIYLVALIVVLLFAFNGCGDGDSEIQSNVITENDLFANPHIKATHETTMVIFLEHPDGEGHDRDIGDKGVDEVSVYYSESFNHTFCWEDDTSDARHSMELIDSSGNTVLTIYNNGECENATITAGHYTMRFTHGGQSESTRNKTMSKEQSGLDLIEPAPIFIRLVDDDINFNTATINTASIQDNINTLATTNSCEECDLSGADLSYADLSGADLSYADLSYAYLFDSDLSRSHLAHADLSYANLSYANLTAANLFGANRTQLDLTGANLSFTIWFDGYICAEGSIGECLDPTP